MKKTSKSVKTTSKKQPADSTKALPKTFQGAAIVRALGMNSDELDEMVEREALDQFDATREIFLVLPDGALANLDDSTEVRGFINEKVAIRYAQAMGHGNVDHRVLRVTQQTLVVGTMNDL
jgi:hypothetical protein